MSPSVRNIIAWILQVLLAAAFIMSGGMKMKDMAGTVHMFGTIGLPGWLAYLVAGGEVLGGIGLLIPRTVRLAAAGLIIIMAGAVIMHATVLPGGMAKGTPALVLLLLLVVVQALRRPTAQLS